MPKFKHSAWSFANGLWSKLENNPLDELPERRVYFDSEIELAGYCKNGIDENQEFYGATIYQAETITPTTERFQFIVEIEIAYEKPHWIFVGCLPDLLQLLPQVSAWRTACRTETLAEAAEKQLRSA